MANTYTFHDEETDQDITIDLDKDCPICGRRMEQEDLDCCERCFLSTDFRYAGFGY